MQKKKFKIININEYNENIHNYVYNKLNNHDKEKLNKMPFDRMNHFIMGRYLMIKEGFDVSKITYNKNNKPLLENTYFNISHSNKYTIFVYDKEPIGIDIEYIRNISDDIKLTFMKKIVSDYEFLKYITKMESYIKLNGYCLKNFNDDTSDYIFDTIKYKNYIITICKNK